MCLSGRDGVTAWGVPMILPGRDDASAGGRREDLPGGCPLVARGTEPD